MSSSITTNKPVIGTSRHLKTCREIASNTLFGAAYIVKSTAKAIAKDPLKALTCVAGVFATGGLVFLRSSNSPLMQQPTGSLNPANICDSLPPTLDEIYKIQDPVQAFGKHAIYLGADCGDDKYIINSLKTRLEAALDLLPPQTETQHESKNKIILKIQEIANLQARISSMNEKTPLKEKSEAALKAYAIFVEADNLINYYTNAHPVVSCFKGSCTTKNFTTDEYLKKYPNWK